MQAERHHFRHLSNLSAPLWAPFESMSAFAAAEILLPQGAPLKLEVSPASQGPQRLVVATRGDVQYRDRINTDSSTSRERFIKKLLTKIGIESSGLAPLIEVQLTKLADEIDKNVRACGQPLQFLGSEPAARIR